MKNRLLQLTEEHGFEITGNWHYDSTYSSFTLPDSDSDSNSDSERFPFGFNCYVLKVYIAQIQTRIPISNGCIGNLSPSPNLSPPSHYSFYGNLGWGSNKSPFTLSVSINAVKTLTTFLSLNTMKSLQHGLQPHFGVTPLYSMREMSLASSR